MSVSESAQIAPFRVGVSDDTLDDLTRRLAQTRFADESCSEAGVSTSYVRELVEYWRSGYDWRSWEGLLNSYPQYTTEIDGQMIHFLHVRSGRPDGLPLILTHGWPGTVVEYLDIIEPLTRAGYHLVIPSIPGFGYSAPLSDRGWNRQRTARAWAELMNRLGYDRYGAVGNDVGSTISLELGHLDSGHVIGVHVTQIFSTPSGAPGELTDLDPSSLDRWRRLQRFMATEGAYLTVHANQPHTLAHALVDSPAGLLAWNAQLFGHGVDRDFTITNVMIYWLTETAGSAIGFYHEDSRSPAPSEPTSIPVALAEFTDDVFASIPRFAHRDHRNIVSWNRFHGGGHYAAHQEPTRLANDIDAFYRRLLTR